MSVAYLLCAIDYVQYSKRCFIFKHVILKFKKNLLYRPRCEKNCLLGFASNKSADQPAHTSSLISTFVIWKVSYIHCLQAKFYYPSQSLYLRELV